jgi:hypothetical protein
MGRRGWLTTTKKNGMVKTTTNKDHLNQSEDGHVVAEDNEDV